MDNRIDKVGNLASAASMDVAGRNEEFLKLFLANQKVIFAYILMLVPNSADAEDLLQETAAVMWRKFDQYQQGTNFTAWGNTIAYYLVLKYREKQRDSLLRFDQEALDMIGKFSSSTVDQIEDRIKALQGCIEKLDEQDRKLVKMRYEGKTTLRDVARNTGRSLNGIYHTMSRIHKVLQSCVNKTLAAWGEC